MKHVEPQREEITDNSVFGKNEKTKTDCTETPWNMSCCRTLRTEQWVYTETVGTAFFSCLSHTSDSAVCFNQQPSAQAVGRFGFTPNLFMSRYTLVNVTWNILHFKTVFLCFFCVTTVIVCWVLIAAKTQVTVPEHFLCGHNIRETKTTWTQGNVLTWWKT